MKTDYTEELKEILKSKLRPSTPEDKEAKPMTLLDIQNQVTSVLPPKWIDESDVYQCLIESGYKTFIHEKVEAIKVLNKKTDQLEDVIKLEHSLRYFVKINI